MTAYDTGYDTGAHTVFYHRYHIVWATKYRYKVLEGDLRRRIRDIIRQLCGGMDVAMIKGVLSRDHVHMLVSIPPKRSVAEVVQRMKGRSSRSIHREFPAIGKRYWGRHFWARGYFCSTAGNITEDIVLSTWNSTARTLPAPAGSGSLITASYENSCVHALHRLAGDEAILLAMPYASTACTCRRVLHTSALPLTADALHLMYRQSTIYEYEACDDDAIISATRPDRGGEGFRVQR